MVTYFDKKDLVNFGKYLLSKERAESLIINTDVFEPNWDTQLEIRSKQVSDADIENFIEFYKEVD